MDKLLQKGKNLLKKMEDKKNEYKSKKEAKKKLQEEQKQKALEEAGGVKPEAPKKVTLLEKLEQEYKKAMASNDTPQKTFKKKFSSKSLRAIVEALLDVSATGASKKTFESIDFNYYFKENYYPLSPVIREFIKRQGSTDFSSKPFQELINEQMEVKKSKKDSSVLFCIAVVGFHHKKGPTVEFIHPDLKSERKLSDAEIEHIETELSNCGMPDAIHHNEDDYVFFSINTPSKENSDKPGANKEKILYGISCFRQIHVTEDMKKRDPDLTRNYLQKAVCVLSELPLFGSIMSKIEPTTRAFFNQVDFKDNEILKSVYSNIDNSLKETQMNIDFSELFIGISLRTLVYIFREKVLMLWKALFLEKRILVYSTTSSSCSNFILCLLSLFPGMLHFKMSSKSIIQSEANLRDYGLPLRIFSNKNPIFFYFTIHHMNSLDNFDGFLMGTTNLLIKNSRKSNADVIVDLDSLKIEISNEKLKKIFNLNDNEKDFINNIIRKTCSHISEGEKKSWKNFELYKNASPEWEGSEDWIRYEFSHYLRRALSELAYFRNFLSTTTKLKRKSQDQGKSQTVNEKSYNILKEDSLSPRGSLVEGILSAADENISNTTDETKEVPENSAEEQSPVRKTSSSEKSVEDNPKSSPEETKKDDEKEEEMNSNINSNKLMAFEEEWMVVDLSESENEEEKEEEGAGGLKPIPKIVRRVSEEEAKKKKLLTAKRKSLIKSLKKFNLKWILAWTQTNNFKYWLKNHDEKIMHRSRNWVDLVEKDVLILESGDIYVGNTTKGMRKGNGIQYDRNNQVIYNGKWVDDIKCGAGIQSTLSQDYIYDGEFNKNLKNGFGRLITSKYKYSGNFKDDQFHGLGVLIEENENIYDGEFRMGEKSGIGKLNTKQGDQYVGDFQKNLFWGKGQYLYSDGALYSGEFLKGKKHGYGTIQYPSNSSYEGVWLNLRSDINTFLLGEWKDDLYEGEGILIKEDMTVFQGKFEKGNLLTNTKTIVKYANGDFYSGEVKNGKPEGQGYFKSNEGEVQEGLFLDGTHKSDEAAE